MQRKAIEALNKKVATGEYRLIKNHCLCATGDTKEDIVLAEKDRYGFPIASIICGKCGLIRSAEVYDDDSNVNFYKNEYRDIYVGLPAPSEKDYLDQWGRGNNLLMLFNSVVPEGIKGSVFELGCGAGGILAPFAEAGMECVGCDYDQKYLDYGKTKGLDLRYGDYTAHTENDSVGLFILSHVLEHLKNPFTELLGIVRKVVPGGFVLIEVPGVFAIHKVYFDPIQYLQNAHIYNYFSAFLKMLLEGVGLNVVYGDERCVFIACKPLGWIEPTERSLQIASLRHYPKRVKFYLAATRMAYLLRLNPHLMKQAIGRSWLVSKILKPIRTTIRGF